MTPTWINSKILPPPAISLLFSFVYFLFLSFLLPLFPRDSLAGPRKTCRVNLGLLQTHAPAVLVLPAGLKMLLRTTALGAGALVETQVLGKETGAASVGKDLGRGALGSGPADAALAKR